MDDRLVFEVQRLYPQVYLACHVGHVRASSTSWRLSSHDAAVLAHLTRDCGMSPRDLASHLEVAASTLSATIKRLVRLGYIKSTPNKQDHRRRDLFLTEQGEAAIASTSVLDAARVRELLAKLSESDRIAAVKGLALLARAAGMLKGDV